MTVREVIEAWSLFPKLGKLSFLLTSGYMKVAYPTEDDAFFGALDRLPYLDFANLPADLQNEFRTFMDTPRYGIWIKKGGDGRGHSFNEAGGHVEQKD